MRPTSARVTGPARAVYALLVLATFAAFFVTQRLKHSPTLVQRVMQTPSFSPGAKHGARRERLSFRIGHADIVTVAVVNARGQDVAILRRSLPLAAYTQLSLRWGGRTDAGRPAPSGFYRLRISLRRQRRTALLARSFYLRRAQASR